MKTKPNEKDVPQALRQVWEWKRQVYEATRKMSLSAALRKMERETEVVRKQYGFSQSAPAARVAEPKTRYGKK